MCVHAHVCYVLRRVQHFHDPMDCSPPGASVQGLSQARMLERDTSPGHLPTQG